MAASALQHDGIVELNVDLSGSPYYSPDMAPTTRAQRRWGVKDLAVLVHAARTAATRGG